MITEFIQSQEFEVSFEQTEAAVTMMCDEQFICEFEQIEIGKQKYYDLANENNLELADENNNTIIGFNKYGHLI